MAKRKPKRQRETINFIASASRIDRWQLCQKIGKVYYHSELSMERLTIIREYLESSGVLKDKDYKHFI